MAFAHVALIGFYYRLWVDVPAREQQRFKPLLVRAKRLHARHGDKIVKIARRLKICRYERIARCKRVVDISLVYYGAYARGVYAPGGYLGLRPVHSRGHLFGQGLIVLRLHHAHQLLRLIKPAVGINSARVRADKPALEEQLQVRCICAQEENVRQPFVRGHFLYERVCPLKLAFYKRLAVHIFGVRLGAVAHFRKHAPGFLRRALAHSLYRFAVYKAALTRAYARNGVNCAVLWHDRVTAFLLDFIIRTVFRLPRFPPPRALP